MANPSADQWLAQAKSDLACAERCLISWRYAATFCHAIAKYQQAVEKSIKGLVVALKLIEPTRDHEALKEIRALQAFSRNPQGAANRNFVRSVGRLFAARNRNQIHSLVQLSPKFPEANELARRNTEYPFQDADSAWKIPADSEVFSPQELNEFRQIANRMVKAADEIIRARQFAPHR